MATCRDCGDFVVFLKRDEGGYMPPVVPVGLDDEGQKLFVADAEGVGRPPPQLYRPHKCLSPDEKAALQRQRAEEKQRLIETDRERRRIARETEEALEAERERAAAEQAELEAIRQAQYEEEQREKEERRLRKAYDKDAELTTARFPQHLLTVPCRDCGQEPGWACFMLTPGGQRYSPEREASRLGYIAERGWFTDHAHNTRYQDGPPNPVRPARTPRWGREYKGPWPPAQNDPGRYDMRSWLTENYAIFSTDERLDEDWMFRMTNRERAQMARFVRTSASILWGDQEEVSDGAGGVAQEHRGGRGEGVLWLRRQAGLGEDAREVQGAGDPVRTDGSGRALEGDREHEDRA